MKIIMLFFCSEALQDLKKSKSTICTLVYLRKYDFFSRTKPFIFIIVSLEKSVNESTKKSNVIEQQLKEANARLEQVDDKQSTTNDDAANNEIDVESAVESCRAEYEAKLAERDERIDALQRQLDAQRAAAVDIDRSECERLNTLLSQRDDELKRLQTSDASQLKQLQSTLDGERVQHNDAVIELQQQLTEASQRAEQSSQQNDTLQTQLNEAKAQLDARASHDDDERDVLQSKIGSLTVNIYVVVRFVCSLFHGLQLLIE
jgi:chromosome segregation ATPase